MNETHKNKYLSIAFGIFVVGFLAACGGPIDENGSPVEEIGATEQAVGTADYGLLTPHPYVASPAVMNIAFNGNFDASRGRLLWADGAGRLGGSRLPAATAVSGVSWTVGMTTEVITKSGYECAGFAEEATGTVIGTSKWTQGDRAIDHCPPAGTVIATFAGGRYDNGHTAIVVGCSSTMLDVFDANWIDSTSTSYQKHVGRHTFNSPGPTRLSNAASYYIVLVP